MSSRPHFVLRDFETVQRDLEIAFARMRNTKDPKLRLTLLRTLRLLLEEADRIIQAE